MRSFFYKQTLPANNFLRNKLLSKLHQLKGSDSESIKGLRQELRLNIKAIKETTVYYRFHKGVRILIGDQTTPKKYFLIYLDDSFINEKLKKIRHEMKAPKTNIREKFIGKYGIRYQKMGNVLVEKNFFAKTDRIFRKSKALDRKIPNTNDEFIGIELEFCSRFSVDQLAEIIADLKLQNFVRAMRDGSIVVTNSIYKHQVELCILAKRSELPDILVQVKALITNINFEINDTCGLHVHLDARNPNKVKQIYKNLVSMQNVLFKLASPARRNNRYCKQVLTSNFDDADGKDHYAAISKFSYFKHQTIEVRLHQSTLDLNLVLKWVNLLKKIADYKGKNLEIGTFDTELGLLKKEVGLDPDLLSYVEEKVN